VGRAAALLALAAALGVWFGVAPHLGRWSLWPDIVLIAAVLMPAMFALVGLALPLWNARGLLLVGIACAALTVALSLAGFDVAANFAKLATMTFVAWWFLTYFEDVSWVVLVALIIPVVDALSVWRGPTHNIVTHRRHVFNALSFAFPVPGKPPHGAACTEGACDMQLGLPDLLFFALFLAAAARWRLRLFWTWLALTASFGVTLTLAVGFSVAGSSCRTSICCGRAFARASTRSNGVTRRSGVPDEERHRLHVRRVREHVDGPRPRELVAVLASQRLRIRRECRRVARNVDKPRRADLPHPLQRFPGETRARRVDDDHVRVPGPLAQFA
jgi:hypothetical protein